MRKKEKKREKKRKEEEAIKSTGRLELERVYLLRDLLTFPQVATLTDSLSALLSHSPSALLSHGLSIGYSIS